MLNIWVVRGLLKHLFSTVCYWWLFAWLPYALPLGSVVVSWRDPPFLSFPVQQWSHSRGTGGANVGMLGCSPAPPPWTLAQSAPAWSHGIFLNILPQGHIASWKNRTYFISPAWCPFQTKSQTRCCPPASSSLGEAISRNTWLRQEDINSPAQPSQRSFFRAKLIADHRSNPQKHSGKYLVILGAPAAMEVPACCAWNGQSPANLFYLVLNVMRKSTIGTIVGLI